MTNHKILSKKSFPAWEDLDITDDFIFSKFMRNEEICKEILNILLPIDVERIEYVEYQKSIDVTRVSKGVRLDVYAKSDNAVFNVEMQIGKSPDLARRSRYYQSAIDYDLLEKGSMYKELKDSFVIFICTFDPFGMGLPCYTFKNVCQEDGSQALEDGRQIIFFNTKAYFKEKNKLRSLLLAFMNGEKINDTKIVKYSNIIEDIKHNNQWRMDYMNLALKFQDYEDLGMQKGIELGREEGQLEKALSTAKNLLKFLKDTEIAESTGLHLEEVKKLRREQSEA